MRVSLHNTVTFVVYFHLHYCIARLQSCINTADNLTCIKSPSSICKYNLVFDIFKKSIAPDKLFLQCRSLCMGIELNLFVPINFLMWPFTLAEQEKIYAKVSPHAQTNFRLLAD